MEVIIRVILMFLFIQFLIVMTIMAVALISARQDVPVLGQEPGQEIHEPGFALVVQLPGRVLRSLARLVRSMYLRSVY